MGGKVRTQGRARTVRAMATRTGRSAYLTVVNAIAQGNHRCGRSLGMLALSHDGLRGYTANVGPGTVSVLDVKARKTLTIIPVSGNVQRIAISNDDR